MAYLRSVPRRRSCRRRTRRSFCEDVVLSGLTIKDIRAVLLVYYHQTTPTTIKKTTAGATLDQAIKQNPGGIYAAPDPSAVATSGSGDSSEEEEASDDEE